MTSLIKEKVQFQKFPDKPQQIPWIVRLIENPQSSFALPGKISLENHDILHILLEKDLSPEGEAFVVGFCMGNDTETNNHHLAIFKFFSKYLYPKQYRFNQFQLEIFDLGVLYGKSLKYKNINKLNLSEAKELETSFLRKYFLIEEKELSIYNEYIRCKKIDQIKKQTRFKFVEILNLVGCSFTVIGGMILAVNLTVSRYGFILLAISSFSMLISAIIEKNIKLAVYFLSVFVCVDLIGVYRWVLS